MRGQEIRNSLDFNDHLSVHEDVRTKTFVELGAFVGNRNSGLPLEGDFRLLQLWQRQPSYVILRALRVKCLILRNGAPRGVNHRSGLYPHVGSQVER